MMKLKEFMLLVKDPSSFFELVKDHDIIKSWKNFIIYELIIFLIGALFFVGHFLLLLFYLPSSLLSSLLSVFFYLLEFIIISVLISSFILSAIMHLGVIIFKGKGDFEDTFRVVNYVGILGIFYGLLWYFHFGIIYSISVIIIAILHLGYLQMVGLKKYHELTTWKTILILILFFLVLSIIFHILFPYFSFIDLIS